MEIISGEAWSWMLYKNENSYYLSVICGSVGIYSTDLELSKEEVFEFKKSGKKYIESLASTIRFKPKAFEKRSLPDFISMNGVKEAAEKWRAEKKL